MPGCRKSSGIQHYVLPRERSGLPEEVRLPDPVSAPAAVHSRMQTAIAQLPQATWFFKTVAPVADFEAVESTLSQFLQSIQFDSMGRPNWTLPAGWIDAGSTPDRFRTIQIPTEAGKTLEMSVTELGPQQDLAQNVNRWRASQLELEPLDEEAAIRSLRELNYVGGKFLVFDEQGMYRGGMSPRPGGSGLPAGHPPAGMPPAGLPSEASGNRAGSEAQTPIQYESPPGWESIPNPMFAALKLEKSSNEQRAAITVSELDAGLNSWETGVGSWLAELERSDLPADQIQARVSSRTIAEQPATLVRLIFPDSPKAICAARLEKDQRAWYFKLSGDRDLVEQSQAEFERFLDSVRFQ